MTNKKLLRAIAKAEAGTFMDPVDTKIEVCDDYQRIIIYPGWSKDNINKCWKLEMYDSKGNFRYEFRTPSKELILWFVECNIIFVED